MAVTIKNYASQMGLPAERLIALLADANVVDKTEDSDLTEREKRLLVMQLQKGRVRQVPRHSEPSVIQPSGRTGSAREIVVEIKGGRTLAPRPIVSSLPTEVQEIETTPATDAEDVADQVEEKIDGVEPQFAEPSIADSEQPVEQPESEKVPAAAEKEQDEPEKITEADAASQEETSDSASELQGQEPAIQAKDVPPAITPAKDEDTSAVRRGKSKRKTVKKQQREQLHVAKGREKLQRDRERRKRSQKLDDRITQHTFRTPSQRIIRSVSVSDSNSIRDLAQAMSVKIGDVIKFLIEEFNLQVTINGSVDRDTATLLVEGLGHHVVEEVRQDIETRLLGSDSDDRAQLPRPPVVAVMGHVDHGKTTLLDSIRSTKVATTEKGGITQHIGAYMVETARGKITFLDTPGHEAFSAMRVRGARATDIVILVVAADDGVMPQTIEAINHAKNANVPIIVAINKMDKTNANPSRVLRELTEQNVIVESLGGDVQAVEISALKKSGIDELLESIQLQAELMDDPLTAPVDGVVSGVVIEARVDKGRGAVVTVLVQKGKLTPKQIVVAGIQKGKVRQLTDHRGKTAKAALPSTPIEIAGFSKVPEVGDEFICPPDERTAQQLIEYRQSGSRDSGTNHAELLFGDSDDPKVINVLIKADVSGSAEAVSSAVKNLSDERVDIKVIHSMVGGINQSDVNLAVAANAIIVAFNVRAEATAKQLINTNDITVIYSGVIYEALDTLKEAILSKVGPNLIEEVIATANVLEVFKFSKVGTVAGCRVEDGTIRNKLSVRVVRDNVIVHNGTIDSLRRFQNDVPEVKAGLECGIQLKNYHDIHIDDMLEIYESREVI